MGNLAASDGLGAIAVTVFAAKSERVLRLMPTAEDRLTSASLEA